MMMAQHKWHKEINAWANGAEIEKWMLNDTWQVESRPSWYDYENYRIKAQPKEPQYLYVFSHSASIGVHFKQHNGLNPNETYLGKIKLEEESE
jgi:hypothetical protein